MLSEKESNKKDVFVIKANEKHNGKYIYIDSIYINAHTKVKIICPLHGEFWQTPNSHLNGRGCPECGKILGKQKLSLGLDKFREKAKEVHGDDYIYDNVDYVNNRNLVEIICKKHGSFWQTPANHLKGRGCPLCAPQKLSISKTLSTSKLTEKFNAIHKGKYDYRYVDYKNCRSKICIVCPIHGDFWQTADDHMQGKGCPMCANKASKGEDEVNDFISTLCHIETVTRSRKLLGKGLECDIIVPSYKLAIEFDGLYWHTENQGKDKNYHLHKTELAESKGYHLIHIFEDEWLEHKGLVLSKIKHYLNCDLDKSIIDISEIVIKTLSKPLVEEFLTTYHLQGFSPSMALYGAFYGGILVGVMTFKKEREGVWNLNRFATNTNYRLPCLASKMFEQFIKDANPIEVKAFLDRRWSCCDENVYNEMGFTLDKVLPPDYEYAHRQQRFSKSKFTKHNLAKKHNFPLSMTEKEMAEKLGYYRIWDCGQCKYIWKPSTYM